MQTLDEILSKDRADKEITAADLKTGDIIMFAMGSSSPDRVAPGPMFRGSICLRLDVIFDVFDHCRCHKWLLGGGVVGCVLAI